MTLDEGLLDIIQQKEEEIKSLLEENNGLKYSFKACQGNESK